MAARDIAIEVVYARPDRQALISLRVPIGSKLEAALEASGIYEQFPGDELQTCPTGIWGRPVPRTHPLAEGDRIELYRPLRIDPREARRQRADL